MDIFAVIVAVLAQGDTLLQRLSPLNRLRVTTGLVLVLILGVVMILIIKAGAHMVHGLSQQPSGCPHHLCQRKMTGRLDRFIRPETKKSSVAFSKTESLASQRTVSARF